jgi:hypothetical protein
VTVPLACLLSFCKKVLKTFFLKNEPGCVLCVKLQSAKQWWSDGYTDKMDEIKLKERARSHSTRSGGWGWGWGGGFEVGRGGIPSDIPQARGKQRGAFGLDTKIFLGLTKICFKVKV